MNPYLAEKPNARGAQGGLLNNVHFLQEKRRLNSNTELIFAGSVLLSIGNVGPIRVSF